jgi:hypothetical protein
MKKILVLGLSFLSINAWACQDFAFRAALTLQRCEKRPEATFCTKPDTQAAPVVVKMEPVNGGGPTACFGNLELLADRDGIYFTSHIFVSQKDGAILLRTDISSYTDDFENYRWRNTGSIRVTNLAQLNDIFLVGDEATRGLVSIIPTINLAAPKETN